MMPTVPMVMNGVVLTIKEQASPPRPSPGAGGLGKVLFFSLDSNSCNIISLLFASLPSAHGSVPKLSRFGQTT